MTEFFRSITSNYRQLENELVVSSIVEVTLNIKA